jgi:hypothetical protein
VEWLHFAQDGVMWGRICKDNLEILDNRNCDIYIMQTQREINRRTDRNIC